ncbi:hypothetical protein PCANC_20312 [Puccinia coronata f. sp. avenae]|uniref:Tudor domain-containing protein n=1 Tax=Puccinia coronata f. sp. avenae TaxID=200324 RepID=A0A2N5SDB3_9BASI|nr:hypothetical protein PCANC_20312 [Puccinia coronata f. sp. avenae]PLW23884.1 hypothetical protein PCASD_13508 [Puccinia coronata f. sp. avenae]
MDAKELETYEYQLSQVNIVLEKDPTNAECLSLKGELVNLITLTKDFLAQTGSSKQTNPSGDNKESSLDPSNNHSTKNSRSGSRIPNEQDKLAKSQGASTQTDALKSLNAGDLCMAKYAGDGKYYPAKITTVGGSSETRIYTVVFKGYDTTELVSASEIRPLTDHKKRNLDTTEQESDKDRKRKKNEKKTENKAAKAAEQLEKQKSWQSFAKKSVKKGVHIPGIVGDSMFASPDNPFGKVGVVGSGKGMTQYGSKQRHKFNGNGAE